MRTHKRHALVVPVVALALAGGCGPESDGPVRRTDRAGATGKPAPRGETAPWAPAPDDRTPPAPREDAPARSGPEVRVGELAPDFALTTTDGKTFKLSEQRGKVVLVNFFATWCVPCMTEMPHLQKEIYEKIRADGFTMLAVGREHDNAEVARFKEKHGLGFPMAGDPRRAVFALYADKSIPRTLVIDRDGKVLFQSVGYSDKAFNEMVALIRQKLAARPR